jgi:hypothetical protein
VRRWWLLLGLAFALPSCGGSLAAAPQLEAATFESPSRVWITGSSGRTLYLADGVVSTRDYPMHPDIDPFMYESMSEIPTARVRIIDGVPVLFLRTGEIFRWQAGWRPFSHLIRSDYEDERPQFDQVLVSPGQLVIQVHSEILLTGRNLDDFARGGFTRRQAPTFFTHLELLGSRMYGIGWDSSGYVRAVYEVASTRFQPLLTLGRDGMNEIVGIFALADESPVAVLRAGIVPVFPNTSLDAFEGFVQTLPRNPTSTPRPDPKRPVLGHVFAGKRGRALLVFDPPSKQSQVHEVVELREDRVLAYHCGGDLGFQVIGALALEPPAKGFRVVTRTPTVIDIPGPTCREVVMPSAVEQKPVLEIPN